MGFNHRKLGDQRAREVVYFKHDFSELKERPRIGLDPGGKASRSKAVGGRIPTALLFVALRQRSRVI
jgi:hypothetical protein